MEIIAGAFKSNHEAIEAAEHLRNQGFKGEISILGPHNEEIFEGIKEAENDAAGVKSMAGSGVAGGLIGLSIGMASFMLPGIGQLAALGPITGLLAGASGGSLAGVAVGALTRWGFSEEESQGVMKSIEAGNSVILIKSEEDEASLARNTLEDRGAEDIM